MVVVMIVMTRREAAWFSKQAALHAAFASTRSDWLLLGVLIERDAVPVGRVRERKAKWVRQRDRDGVGHRRQHSGADSIDY